MIKEKTIAAKEKTIVIKVISDWILIKLKITI